MIFELDTAKIFSLREQSRHSLVERENDHLKTELGSKLVTLGRSMNAIVGHFDAADVLAQARADIAHLKEEACQNAVLTASLAQEKEGLEAKLEAANEDKVAASVQHDKELAHLRRAVKKEEDKWKAQVSEANRTCQKLQDQLDKRSGSNHYSAGSGSKSLELMWKQKVLSLMKDTKALQEENEALKDQLRRAEAYKPRSRSAKRTKLTK